MAAFDACPTEQSTSCITCGDVAIVLTVIDSSAADARCRDDAGREETVATELVGEVSPGDSLLVHAGVALEKVLQR